MHAFDTLARIDMNLLLTLVVLVQTKSVSESAKRLRLSQSATSHRLAKLREFLGDELLVPEGNAMAATAFAERLVAPLREQLLAMEHALASRGSFDAAASDRRFHVVGPESAQTQLLPLLAPQLAARAPRITLSFVSPFPGLLEALREGTIDLAVLSASADAPPWMATQTIFRAGYVLLLARGQPAPPTLEAYLALDHVVVTDHAARLSPVDAYLAERRITRRTPLRVSSFHAALSAVAARPGLGWTTSSETAQWASERLPVEVHALPFAPPEVEIVAAWHRRYDDDTAHAWLRSLLLEARDALRPGAARSAVGPRSSA